MQETEYRSETGIEMTNTVYTKQEHEGEQRMTTENTLGNQLFAKPQLNNDQRQYNHFKQQINPNSNDLSQSNNASRLFNNNNNNNKTDSINLDLSTLDSINYNSALNANNHTNNNSNHNENIVEQLLRSNYQDPIDASHPLNCNNPENGVNINNSNNNNNLTDQEILGKTYNLQTYELQPEIKGVQNHKIVEEIAKLGFGVTDSNVFMVWDEWMKEKETQGKTLPEFGSILKEKRNTQKKNLKARKYSGRYSTDDDEDEDDDNAIEEEENYRGQLEDSNEFDENLTEDYGQNRTNKSRIGHHKSKNGNYDRRHLHRQSKRDFLNQKGNKSDDFDSDYDESYKNKVKTVESFNRKQSFQNESQFDVVPRKQLKLHGDHYLFYNHEMGQCIYCAQKNKENEVFTSCMECEGQGKSRFFICEECFDTNHASTDINHANQNKKFIKHEELEQPFVEDSDDDMNSASSDGIQLKKLNENNGQDTSNQDNCDPNKLNGRIQSGQDNISHMNSNNHNNNDNQLAQKDKLKGSNEDIHEFLKRVEQQGKAVEERLDAMNNECLIARISKQNMNNSTFETNNDLESSHDIFENKLIDNSYSQQQNTIKKKLKIFRNPQSSV